jgi:Zn-dependent alcohol dehydrogenase
MRATAAVLYELNKPLIVEDVEVLEPGPREVLVRWVANEVKAQRDRPLLAGRAGRQARCH